MRPQHPITFPRNLHPGAWWLWAIGLAAAATRTQNPVPLLLILAVGGLVVSARRSNAPWAKSYGAFLKLALLIIAIRIAFQALLSTGSQGPTVLFTLPSLPMPEDSGLKLGGEVTLEAVLRAFYEGLQLGVILCCVGAANALGSARRLLRYVPGALYEIGVACVIALTFAPQLVTDAQRVRAAHRLRGRSTRGPRSLARLAMPVLEGALEHSVELAAAMDSRGYGRTTDTGRVSRRLTARAGVRRAARGLRRGLRPPRRHHVGLARHADAARRIGARGTRRLRRRPPDRPHAVPARPVGAARSGWSPAAAWSRRSRRSSTCRSPPSSCSWPPSRRCRRCRCWPARASWSRRCRRCSHLRCPSYARPTPRARRPPRRWPHDHLRRRRRPLRRHAPPGAARAST